MCIYIYTYAYIYIYIYIYVYGIGPIRRQGEWRENRLVKSDRGLLLQHRRPRTIDFAIPLCCLSGAQGESRQERLVKNDCGLFTSTPKQTSTIAFASSPVFQGRRGSRKKAGGGVARVRPLLGPSCSRIAFWSPPPPRLAPLVHHHLGSPKGGRVRRGDGWGGCWGFSYGFPWVDGAGPLQPSLIVNTYDDCRSWIPIPIPAITINTARLLLWV